MIWGINLHGCHGNFLNKRFTTFPKSEGRSENWKCIWCILGGLPSEHFFWTCAAALECPKNWKTLCNSRNDTACPLTTLWNIFRFSAWFNWISRLYNPRLLWFCIDRDGSSVANMFQNAPFLMMATTGAPSNGNDPRGYQPFAGERGSSRVLK